MTQGFVNQQTLTVLSGAGAPTVTPSFTGQLYLDTTAKREYRAYGTSSSADWLKVPVFYSGTATVTGSSGDVTVTLPWDWTNGRLEVIVSEVSSNYYDNYGTTATTVGYETSYDALTNTNYTDHQVFVKVGTDNLGAGWIVVDKTSANKGEPTSATSKTFTLNDSGTTVYVKYFVWA